MWNWTKVCIPNKWTELKKKTQRRWLLKTPKTERLNSKRTINRVLKKANPWKPRKRCEWLMRDYWLKIKKRGWKKREKDKGGGNGIGSGAIRMSVREEGRQYYTGRREQAVLMLFLSWTENCPRFWFVNRLLYGILTHRIFKPEESTSNQHHTSIFMNFYFIFINLLYYINNFT